MHYIEEVICSKCDRELSLNVLDEKIFKTIKGKAYYKPLIFSDTHLKRRCPSIKIKKHFTRHSEEPIIETNANFKLTLGKCAFCT